MFNNIFNICVKTGFDIKLLTMVDMPLIYQTLTVIKRDTGKRFEKNGHKFGFRGDFIFQNVIS